MEPFVSVLTPTWNRASYLPRVWEGLAAQSCRNFEWIVANDGSADDTVEVVRALAQKSDFPVHLISASCRIGKSRMDNEAVKASRGEFVLWCDSDDMLLPEALKTLQCTWEAIPKAERSGYLGVTALCRTSHAILGSAYPSFASDITLNELLLQLKSDLVILARAEAMKTHPFPEVDFLIPETSVWNQVGVRMTRFVPVALKQANYGEAHCVSFSGLMEYNRGRAHAMSMSNRYVKGMLTARERLVRLLNFIRFSIHGEIPPWRAMRMWGGGLPGAVALCAAYPLMFAVAVRDNLQRKVRKTHRDFLRAARSVRVTAEALTADAS